MRCEICDVRNFGFRNFDAGIFAIKNQVIQLIRLILVRYLSPKNQTIQIVRLGII
jgi:hypothetical protein